MFANIGKNMVYGALVLVLSGSPAVVWSHAFPERSEPRVGSTVTVAPAQVRIWFDAALEPAFSSIVVHDSAGRQIDRKDSRVTSADSKVLEVTLMPLSSGRYHVVWKVVSRDGHRTNGDFLFEVK